MFGEVKTAPLLFRGEEFQLPLTRVENFEGGLFPILEHWKYNLISDDAGLRGENVHASQYFISVTLLDKNLWDEIVG